MSPNWNKRKQFPRNEEERIQDIIEAENRWYDAKNWFFNKHKIYMDNNNFKVYIQFILKLIN